MTDTDPAALARHKARLAAADVHDTTLRLIRAACDLDINTCVAVTRLALEILERARRAMATVGEPTQPEPDDDPLQGAPR